DHEKAISVRVHVIRVQELPFEKHSWPASAKRWLRFQFDDHHFVPIPVEEISAISGPASPRPPSSRDLPFRARTRERPDEDLVAPRLVRIVGNPAPIGRELGAFLIKASLKKRISFPCTAERQNID